MAKKIIVPPYVESPSDYHCGQSVTLMILTHFVPKKEWSFTDVDKIHCTVEGKWSWAEAAAVSMAQMGFEVKHYTDLDTAKFIESPETYFIEKQGEEAGSITTNNIDIPSSVEICKRYLADTNIVTFNEGWTIEDMNNLLKQGYLLSVWVNPKKLYIRNSADTGHSVLVFNYDEKRRNVTLHDPGWVPVNGGRMSMLVKA